MSREGAGRPEHIRHIIALASANLVSAVVLTVTYYFISDLLGRMTPAQAAVRVTAGICALAFCFASCGLMVLSVERGRPVKARLQYIAGCFLLTAPFVWVLKERRIRREAEEKLRRLEVAGNRIPDVTMIAGIIDPKMRKPTLSRLVDEMDDMRDSTLAMVLDAVATCAEEFVSPAGGAVDYDLLRQLIGKASQYGAGTHPETYASLLCLLSDIFRMPPEGHFTRKVQRDMLEPLENAVRQSDEPHLNRLRALIEQVMAAQGEDHDLARALLRMLLSLDWKENRDVCQMIFDESKKRAFKYPQDFGYDMLCVLRDLSYRVFWLDIDSLQDIMSLQRVWDQTIEAGKRERLDSKRIARDDLSSKVFAPVDTTSTVGMSHGRVFRRLNTRDGRVVVRCTLADGRSCSCQAESLSFRGFYSSTCSGRAGQKMRTLVIPSDQVGQPGEEQEFTLVASVAKTHATEEGRQVGGRGIFFEDADETAVKRLYDYISKHPAPQG